MKMYTLLENRNTLHKGAVIEYDEEYGKYLYKGDTFALSITGGMIYPEDRRIDKYEVEHSPDKFMQTDFFIRDLDNPQIKVYKDILRMLIDNTKHPFTCYLDSGTQSIGVEHNYPEFIFGGGSIRYSFERTEDGNEKIIITKKKVAV